MLGEKQKAYILRGLNHVLDREKTILESHKKNLEYNGKMVKQDEFPYAHFGKYYFEENVKTYSQMVNDSEISVQEVGELIQSIEQLDWAKQFLEYVFGEFGDYFNDDDWRDFRKFVGRKNED